MESLLEDQDEEGYWLSNDVKSRCSHKLVTLAFVEAPFLHQRLHGSLTWMPVNQSYCDFWGVSSYFKRLRPMCSLFFTYLSATVGDIEPWNKRSWDSLGLPRKLLLVITGSFSMH